MTAVVEINKLELELKELQKKRGDVEYRLKSLENKEKAQQGLLGKRIRNENSNLQNKKVKENTSENARKEDGRGLKDDSRSSFNNRGASERERETQNRSSRLSSVVTGQRSGGNRDLKDSYSNRTNKEEPRKPKLTSAIVSSTPIPIVGEKPRPSLDTSSEETKKRSKNIFGVLVGTLKSFKNEISKKSEAEQRREELEQKVQMKVKEEAESFKEEQRRVLQEQKDKELALREEIKQQQEQKELELLNLKWDNHRNQLASFFKTEAKPAIYYKPAKEDFDKSKMEGNEKREEK